MENFQQKNFSTDEYLSKDLKRKIAHRKTSHKLQQKVFLKAKVSSQLYPDRDMSFSFLGHTNASLNFGQNNLAPLCIFEGHGISTPRLNQLQNCFGDDLFVFNWTSFLPRGFQFGNSSTDFLPAPITWNLPSLRIYHSVL